MNNVNPEEAVKTATKVLEELGYSNFIVAVAKEEGKKIRQKGVVQGKACYAIDLLQGMLDGARKEALNSTLQRMDDVLQKILEEDE